MSRTFTKNLSNYMSLGANSLGSLMNGAAFVALSCWAKAASFTSVVSRNTSISAQIGVNTTAIGFFVYDGSANKLRVLARSQSSDSSQIATGTTTLSTGTLYHFGVLIDYAADTIYLYLNGSLETTASVTFAGTTYTHTNVTDAGYHDAVGSFFGTAVPISTDHQFDGEIGECALWAHSSAPLVTADFAALYAGKSPLRVGAVLPAWYMQIQGSASPETSLRGSLSGTITGSLPQATHPTVYGYPSVFTPEVLRAA